MTVSNASMTLGSILGAITTTANTFSSSLDALNSGVGMLNKTVTDAAKKQSIDSIIDMEVYQSNAIETKSQQLAESRKKVLEWCAQSDQNSSLYSTAYNQLSALFPKA